MKKIKGIRRGNMAGILTGRRMVITGASRGVGFEICKLFLKEGASIMGVGKEINF